MLSEQVRLPLPGRVGHVGSVPGVKGAHPWLSSQAPRWGEIGYRIYEPEYLASFWRETSPAGATQESPGRKPWEEAQ